MQDSMTLKEKHPLVVFVILTCNQREMTLKCLASLEKCEYPEKKVILVDNGSADGTLQEVEAQFPEVIRLRNETNLGAAAGRNCGIDHAQEHYPFEYLMFMDNDIVVEPDFLTKLVEGQQRYRDHGVIIASPKLFLMDEPAILDCAGGAKVNFYTGSTRTRGHGEEDHGQYDHDPMPDCVPATVLVHRRGIERAVHFDVSFDPYGYEDLDMVLRANAPGTPFLFVPDAVVYHKGSKTGFTGYSEEYTKVKAKNFKRFLKRHSTPLQRLCFFTLLPFLAIKPILRELRKGNIGSVIGLIKGFLKS